MNKIYLDFSEALEKSLNLAQETTKIETINISLAIGRIIARDIICIKNLPSFNNSAMDGFAIKASDKGKELTIKKVIFAGNNQESCLKKDECYKIMTGAKVPDDVDTIIPIENVEYYDDKIVKIKNDVKKGSSLRLKGEEKEVGEVLFHKGDEVNSSIIAVLASQGLVMIEVYKKLSIAVVSTGNEIIEPWENANENEIYNCNSYAIISLLNEKKFEATYTNIVPDNLENSIKFINDLKSYDVIITSGGISMGDADFMDKAFEENGLNVIFNGVNIKPGRPITMGKMNNTFVICLPGNPLTAMVNMHLFGIPILRKIQASNSFYHDIEKVKNTKLFMTKKGRVNIVLGEVLNGKFNVTLDNNYGSGMITAVTQSNCIYISNPDKKETEENEEISIIRFNCSYLKENLNIVN